MLSVDDQLSVISPNRRLMRKLVSSRETFHGRKREKSALIDLPTFPFGRIRVVRGDEAEQGTSR